MITSLSISPEVVAAIADAVGSGSGSVAPTTAETRLDPETIEAVARRVVVLLREEGQGSFNARGQHLDASAVAATYGLRRSWVYAHADELGAIRLGEGKRARLRFDPETVAERLASCSAHRGSEGAETLKRKPTSRSRPRKPMGTNTELLPVRGLRDGKSPSPLSPETNNERTTQ